MATRPPSTRTYIPAAGHDWLLPLYDPLHTLIGGGAAHRRLVELTAIQSRNRVLEIGCGTGNLSVLVKRLHPDADVVGLDPDPKALARAARKADQSAVRIQLDRGFSDELPYPDRSFDRVLSAFMFHHLEPDERRKTLRDVRRVLVPGGSFHLLDFAGAHGRCSRFLARLFHRSQRASDDLDEGVPAMMRDAGLADPAEVANRMTIFGRIAYHRASRAE